MRAIIQYCKELTFFRWQGDSKEYKKEEHGGRWNTYMGTCLQLLCVMHGACLLCAHAQGRRAAHGHAREVHSHRPIWLARLSSFGANLSGEHHSLYNNSKSQYCTTQSRVTG